MSDSIRIAHSHPSSSFFNSQHLISARGLLQGLAMRAQSMFAVALVGLIPRSASAVHACDAENGSACPFDAGFALGDCLKNPAKHEAPTEISDGCKTFMALHDACK